MKEYPCIIIQGDLCPLGQYRFNIYLHLDERRYTKLDDFGDLQEAETYAQLECAFLNTPYYIVD